MPKASQTNKCSTIKGAVFSGRTTDPHSHSYPSLVPKRHRPLWPSSLHAKLHAKLRTVSHPAPRLIDFK